MILRPGDVFIVGVDRPALTLAQAHAMKDKIMERLPGLKDVLIIAGTAGMAAYREEEEPA